MRLRFICAVLLLLMAFPAHSEKQRSYIKSSAIVQVFMDSLSSASFANLDSLILDESKVDSLLDGFIAYYDLAYRDEPGTKVRPQLADSLNVRLEARRIELEAARKVALFPHCVIVKVKDLYHNHKGLIDKYWPFAVIGIVLIVTLLIIRSIRRKREATEPTFKDEPQTQDSEPEIVVRRKTTTILKKQSLEDVLTSNSYLRIDASDFCPDSAVRRMYIKNTCIKDIYNMYSDDLRNPDNPKEDGCMVLGRWVYDNETDEYYVSLEYVVMPGDDAVFKEYELNFGGKIKLRVAENLRRLRRDTDLQYDLTCWVHSHPGLGVFFSNFDNGVHLQLKHSTHPKFLTAIVVDILTPDMELGIFTFKKGNDLVVNSKQDITRMYSLEEMYQWALSSEMSLYKQEDYFDVLAGAQVKADSCAAIRLSNGAIIDMGQILAGQPSGLAGLARGFVHTHGISTEFIVEQVAQEQAVSDYDMLGCFVVGSHLSVPSIQKAISDNAVSARFVMFFSTTMQALYVIPMQQGVPVMDEKYYSEETMENLKIWTRRRR